MGTTHGAFDMLLIDQIYLQFSSLLRCQNHFHLNHSQRTFSSGEKCNILIRLFQELLSCTAADDKEKFRTFLRFELFFPISSLLTVSTAQLTEDFRVPFNFNTSLLRALFSAGGFSVSTSVIVLDDDRTQGRHILLLFMMKVVDRITKQQ